MKLLVIATLAVVTASVLAQPRHHAHLHLRRALAKRETAAPAIYIPAPVETVVVYELEGRPISEDEVRQGLQNGTLVWGDDGNLSSSIATPIATLVAESVSLHGLGPTPTSTSVKESPVVVMAPSSRIPPEQEPSSISTSTPAPAASASGEYSGACPDCDKAFPNGKYSCDVFPTGYGAVSLTNEGLGGWAGIQEPRYRKADGFDDIMTVPTGTCTNGACCKPGRYCSYGCPNPYLKMSFPKLQGKTKQSVGGLYCNENGKLEMADGSIGKTLCGKGSDRMTVKVENKLSQPVSICRTDYPGTESMTIPLTVGAGETAELANPNQGAYYFWDGKPTSAQYYINNKGVTENEACTWGTTTNTAGNWAPLNFGTSWDDIAMNRGFSSLAPNNPTTDAKLDFTVTFSGDGVQNACKFNGANGKYCMGPANDYSQCGDVGCTASVKSGSTLTLTFTE